MPPAATAPESMSEQCAGLSRFLLRCLRLLEAMREQVCGVREEALQELFVLAHPEHLAGDGQREERKQREADHRQHGELRVELLTNVPALDLLLHDLLDQRREPF